jgi:hypothetical protein
VRGIGYTLWVTDSTQHRGEPGFEKAPGVDALKEPETAPAPTRRPGRRHLVVVVTRAVRPEDEAAASAVLVTRFWHPRDRRWSENFFESLDHAIRLFVDESGWTLLQQQPLAGTHEYELIFDARQEDFTGPTTEQMLEEAGLTPSDVRELLDNGQP